MNPRFYSAALLEGPLVELAGPEAHHLLHVLRLKAGMRVALFDGLGTEATAEIETIAKKAATLRILELRTMPPATPRPIVVAAAVPKGDRFRWMVEKLAELGVSRLIPLETARSVVDPGEGKLDRMRQAVIAAAKQSGSNWLMRIDEPLSWGEFLSQCGVRAESPEQGDSGPQLPLMVAHPGGVSVGEFVHARMQLSAAGEPLFLALGPEGGFTDAEVEQAQLAGAQLVSLGRQILRIETAAIALASLLVLTLAPIREV